jgi:hypothetical protein
MAIIAMNGAKLEELNGWQNGFWRETRDCNRLMTEKLFVMELIPSGVFDDLPIELNVWPTRLSEILDMSLSIILFFECG